MATILHATAEDALVAAIEENTAELYRVLLPRLPGAEVHDEIDVLHGRSVVRTPLCNAIVCARFGAAPGVDERIEEVLAPFRRRRLPVTWWIGPLTTPADLGRRLGRRGFRRVADMPGMTIDLDELPEPEPPRTLLRSTPSVLRVRDAVELGEWTRAFSQGFRIAGIAAQALHGAFAAVGYREDAGCRQYLARIDGRPVGSATVVLGAGVAGLYNIATAPRARRRGVGRAITLAALADARAAGYRYAILHATAMGERLYRALGFQERCRVQTWTRG